MMTITEFLQKITEGWIPPHPTVGLCTNANELCDHSEYKRMIDAFETLGLSRAWPLGQEQYYANRGTNRYLGEQGLQRRRLAADCLRVIRQKEWDLL